MEKMAYDVEEACHILGIRRSLLYKEMKDGNIVARKMGRRTVFLPEDLKKYASSRPAAY